MRSRLGCLVFLLVAFSVAVRAQIEPIPNLKVQPTPVPGGDIVPSYGFATSFLPGPPNQTPSFDPMNADPHVITNFRGVTAIGYTSGPAMDSQGNKYIVITDIRVYQGEYIGGEIADPNSAGATKSAHARGTFVEIWIDLWDLSLRTQLHDFSPWTLPNGLFWTVKVPDSAVQITDNTLTIHLVDVPTVDAFSFPPPPQNVPGISPFHLIPAKVSFDIVYTKTGNPRRIRRASHDPLSPLNWAGKMWDATNSGTFSLTYDDGTFSASGSFDSSGNFGEMGTERNGLFLNHEEEDANDDANSGAQSLSLSLNPAQMSQGALSGIDNQPVKLVLLRGRVPVKVSH